MPKRSTISHSLLDSLSCAILVLDQNFNIEYFNETALSVFDVGKTTLAHLPIHRLIDGEFIDNLRENTQTYPYTPFTQRNIPLNISGQSIIADLIVSELPDQVAIDCTQTCSSPAILIEIHPLDRLTIIARNSQLEYHHEAIKQLSRNLAHEIKNPLGGILGAAQLLDGKLDEADSELLTIISHEVQRLQRLVDDMLGPNQPLSVTEFNIHQLLNQIIRLMNADEQTITIHADFDPSIPELQADYDRLSVLFINLISNAKEAALANDHTNQRDNPPHVTITTRIERQFTLHNRRHRMALKISISDNGAGIPESIRHQIFLPTITNKSTGNGLGLAIAQNIAHQHKGMIDLEHDASEAGETTFAVFLPFNFYESASDAAPTNSTQTKVDQTL